MKERFEGFLKAHDVHAEFMHQLKHGEEPVFNRPTDFDVFTELYNNTPENWIWDAFMWEDSPSGYLYWNDLAVEWNELLSNEEN